MSERVLGKRVKASGEKKRYVIDYTDWLDTGEQVATVAFAVSVDSGTPPASPSPINVASSLISSDGLSVSMFVQAGDDGVTYKLIITAHTTGGQVKEDVIFFLIEEP